MTKKNKTEFQKYESFFAKLKPITKNSDNDQRKKKRTAKKGKK